MPDEKSAVIEIRHLSDNARRYLQHTLRNGLQSIVASIEEGSGDNAAECALSLSRELQRLGL